MCRLHVHVCGNCVLEIIHNKLEKQIVIQKYNTQWYSHNTHLHINIIFTLTFFNLRKMFSRHVLFLRAHSQVQQYLSAICCPFHKHPTHRCEGDANDGALFEGHEFVQVCVGYAGVGCVHTDSSTCRMQKIHIDILQFKA